MADGDKPYRVYKGGRVKGRCPPCRPDRSRPAEAQLRETDDRPRWGRRIGLAVLALVLLSVVWLAAGYLCSAAASRTRTSGCRRRSRRPRAAGRSAALEAVADPPARHRRRPDGRPRHACRSDSILLLRTEPGRHRLSYLSIPRDLRVDIPGFGLYKINAAYQLGGAALTMRTVRALTGLQPNHVVMVDFADFRSVIDALGGVEVDVPKPILSNRFDCPYKTQARCQQWQGWRFEKGKQTMDGRAR